MDYECVNTPAKNIHHHSCVDMCLIQIYFVPSLNILVLIFISLYQIQLK